MQQRHVVFVIFDDFQSLDLLGPYEVFQGAQGYRCRVVATRPGPVPSDSGLPIGAESGIGDVAPASVDTLVVAGGPGTGNATNDAPSWRGSRPPRAGPAASPPNDLVAMSGWND